MPMAPEGWPFIIPGWLLTAAAAWLAETRSPWWWVGAGVLGVLSVWLLVFFRNPARTGPRGTAYVISPADGEIVSVAGVPEPLYLKGETTRISIFMNVFNVHVNRYPVSGRVELVRYNPGKFLHAAREKASLDNEQASVGIRGPHGPLLVRQIAGSIARRIVTDSREGENVTQAERLGMIRFGSRVDVFLPAGSGARVRVALGDKVHAGASVLAEYGA
ncbi:MAG TPA: phosphatidylserine decarboxylase family protein [Gemmatimonadales bacterium]|nr:phosphatidylserine decarboxylase family protein [Gemmatimonadales bacterium]